ncbi:hypothetical protein [Xanthomonas sp. XNM01]|uniref:hypothetical protein n=1 Tax=Xanthomonas sp. XNM01 TaxID=2769289 RepID=UPI00177FC8A8|nr:hypothetical protein [Xanthomonas sp. XNM01]MBD9368833.1 hypothetical protein [Xanthomonas sp. XNM01]
MMLLLAGCHAQEAKEKVRQALKDPASAQWRNVNVIYSNVVCGEVNAKNSMGGYAGFQRFLVRNGRLYLGNDSTESAAIFVCCAQIDGLEKHGERYGYSKQGVADACDALQWTLP